MIAVGKVRELWRYPVKCMGGERIESGVISASGLRGDRRWALRDENRREICTGHGMPSLARCRARYLHEPEHDESAPVALIFPDGSSARSDSPGVHDLLTSVLGHPLTLWPVVDADEADHYRRKAEPLEALAVTQMSDPGGAQGRWRDGAARQAVGNEFVTRPGTYHRLAPIHLMTTASLAFMRTTGLDFDGIVARFRPNALLEATRPGRALPESGWIGRVLAVGDARVYITGAVDRAQASGAGPVAPSSLDPTAGHADRHPGVYAEVVRAGEVREGDTVHLMD